MKKLISSKAAALLCCVTILICIAIVGRTLAAEHDGEHAPSARAWQYMALEHDVTNGPLGGELGKTITKVGRDGWELVSTANYSREGTTVTTVFYFKKPL